MDPQQCPFASPVPTEDDSDSDLGQILRACIQHRRLIAKWTIAVTFLVVLYSLYQPNIYRSTTTVVVPGDSGKGGGLRALLSAQFGGLEGLSGITNSFEMYIQVLKSRRVAQAVIKKCDLQRHYDLPTMDQTVAAFGLELDVQNVRDTDIVSISFPVRSEQSFPIPRSLLGLLSPDRELAAAEFAAAVAGATRQALDETVVLLSTRSAQCERDFLEQRLSAAQSDLTSSEARLAAYKLRGGAVAPQAQAAATLQAVGQLQGSIIQLRAKQQALGSALSDRHPEVVALRAEIAGLEGQIGRLETPAKATIADQPLNAAGIFLPLYLMPSVEQEFTSLVRETVVKAAIYVALLQQYEQSAIISARNVAPLKILDEPSVPLTKWGPRRGSNCILAVLIGLLVGLSHVLWLEVGRRLWGANLGGQSQA